MGEKQNNNGGGEKNNDKKKEEPKSVTVVLKADMHCEGCASKMVKILRSFDGVESVKSDAAANKLTVIGAVDPSQIREKLQNKTKKKIELISPQPKKDKENNNGGRNKEAKPENKQSKEKEPPVTTAVLKVSFHCQGCIDKIVKIVTRFKGVHDMSLDKQKDLVTVKGTMDVKSLVEALKDKLKKPVEIVPPKKEKEGGGENNGGGGGGGGKKKKGGDDGGKDESHGGGGGNIVEGNRMEYMGPPGGFGFGYEYGYPYPMQYHPGQVQMHAPQMFSDENPNACSVM